LEAPSYDQRTKGDSPKEYKAGEGKQRLAGYTAYFLSGTPKLDDLAMGPATYNFRLRWFQEEYSAENLPGKPNS
jgi:hypothetical protein